jgi:hypothetical protein
MAVILRLLLLIYAETLLSFSRPLILNNVKVENLNLKIAGKNSPIIQPGTRHRVQGIEHKTLQLSGG